MTSAWLLGASAVAGASFVWIEIAVRDVPPAWVAAARAGLGWLVLAVVGLRAGRGALAAPGRARDVHLVAAVQVAGPFALLAAGQQRLPAGVAAVMVACVPLLTALASPWLVAGTRWSRRELAVLGVGLAGVALAVGGARGASVPAVGAVALAAVGFALGGLLAKRLLPGPPLAVARAVLGAAALQLVPLALLRLPAGPPGAEAAAALLVLGTLGTGAVFLAIFTVIARAGATRAALLDYGAPAFGVVYAAAVLGERLSGGQAAGVALVTAACLTHGVATQLR